MVDLAGFKYKVYLNKVILIQQWRWEMLFLLLVFNCKEYSNMIPKIISFFIYSSVRERDIKIFFKLRKEKSYIIIQTKGILRVERTI